MRRVSVLAFGAIAVTVVGCEPGGDDAGQEAPDGTDTAQDEPAEPGEDPPPPEADPPGPEERADPRHAWVGVEDGNELVRVDLDEHEVVERHELPGGPHNITVAPNGLVAGALYGGTSLALADDGDIELVELGDSPHDVKAIDEGFVVANEVAERLDLVSFAGEHLGEIPTGGEPHDVAVAPDAATAWVTINGTDELAVVDLDRRTVTERVATGTSPHDILFEPGGEAVWVTDWDGPVHVLDGDGEVRDTLPVGEEAHHLAFTPDGGQAWITDHATREAIVIDTREREVLDRLEIAGSPHHVHITPDGEVAVVADHTYGELVVFEVDTREEVATVAVGPGPHGVWTVPADG